MHIYIYILVYIMGIYVYIASQVVPCKECLQRRRCGKRELDSRVRKIPWSRKRQPTPVFFPGKFHRQRSLVGYSPFGLQRAGHD